MNLGNCHGRCSMTNFCGTALVLRNLSVGWRRFRRPRGWMVKGAPLVAAGLLVLSLHAVAGGLSGVPYAPGLGWRGWPGLLRVQAPAGGERFGLFGTLEFQTGRLDAIPNWIRARSRIETERATYRACDTNPAACPSQRVAAWRQRIAALRGQDRMTQLRAINQFLNHAVPYIIDQSLYGVSDYWASPMELLQRGGDCEDFAIAKFESLLDLGFTNDQMRIVILLDTLRNLPHAVLAVELDGQSYILDNVTDAVLSHDRLPQYRPQFSVNWDRRWAHVISPSAQARFRAAHPLIGRGN